MDPHGKVVLITGSSARVGKSIAKELSHKGAKIVIHYHTNKTAALKTVEEISACGKEALLVRGDISIKSDWQRMKKEIIDRFKRIDILVNNAAIFGKTPFLLAKEIEMNKFFNVNLKGTIFGCQIIGSWMYERRCGKIINIADVSAESVWPNYIPYCITKAGVIALTKGLAKELAPHVTVNAVSPGTVLLADNYDKEEESILIERTPLKRVGSPQDIAKTVCFLIEGSDFITGEIIKVDGGRSIT